MQVLLVAGHFNALDLAPNHSTNLQRGATQVGTGSLDDVLVPKMWLPWIPPYLWSAPVSIRKLVQQDIRTFGGRPFPRISLLLCDAAASIQALRDQDVAQDLFEAAECINSSELVFSNMVEELSCI